MRPWLVTDRALQEQSRRAPLAIPVN